MIRNTRDMEIIYSNKLNCLKCMESALKILKETGNPELYVKAKWFGQQSKNLSQDLEKLK